MIEQKRKKSAIFYTQMVDFCMPGHIYKIMNASLLPQVVTRCLSVLINLILQHTFTFNHGYNVSNFVDVAPTLLKNNYIGFE